MIFKAAEASTPEATWVVETFSVIAERAKPVENKLESESKNELALGNAKRKHKMEGREGSPKSGIVWTYGRAVGKRMSCVGLASVLGVAGWGGSCHTRHSKNVKPKAGQKGNVKTSKEVFGP